MRLRWVRRFIVHKPLGAVSAFVIILIITLSLFAPQFAPNDPGLSIVDPVTGSTPLLHKPSFSNWLGTDQLGRDELSRILYGGRISLVVGLGGVLLATAGGSAIGIIAGFSRRHAPWVDSLLMLIVESLMSIPSLIIALAFVAVEPVRFMDDPTYRGLANVTAAIGIATLPAVVRLVRSATLSVRENLYVEAAQAAGATNTRIMFFHILPNVMPIIVVYSMTIIAWAILLEASLSFLGIGISPGPLGHPLPTSWGRMLSESQGNLIRAPWLVIAPGVAISLLIFAFNMLGDAFRDITDPRLRGR
jgi:peptide/nickel transport system permease protein